MNKKIQFLRGISICAVVAIHSNANGIVQVLDRPFLNFCVAMFLFISGFLTDINIGSIIEFCKRRISRVVIPYFVWSIIYGSLRIVTGDFIIKEFIIDLLTGKTCGPFYYIFVYMQLVVLTPIIIKIATSRYKNLAIFISPISILISRYICMFYEIELPFPFGAENVFNWFVFYYIGILLGNKLLRIDIKAKKTIVIYFVSILFSIMEGLFWYKHGNIDMATTQLRLTSIATSLISIFMAYIFIENSKIKMKVGFFNDLIVLIGDISFGIYLSHIAVKSAIMQIPIMSNVPFPFFTLIILATNILCILFGRKICGKRISRKYLGL